MYALVKILTLSNEKIATLLTVKGVLTFQMYTLICGITTVKWIQVLPNRNSMNNYGQSVWKLRFGNWFGMPSCLLICLVIKVKYFGLKNEVFLLWLLQFNWQLIRGKKKKSDKSQKNFSPVSAWCKFDVLIWFWKKLWHGEYLPSE